MAHKKMDSYASLDVISSSTLVPPQIDRCQLPALQWQSHEWKLQICQSNSSIPDNLLLKENPSAQ